MTSGGKDVRCTNVTAVGLGGTLCSLYTKCGLSLNDPQEARGNVEVSLWDAFAADPGQFDPAARSSILGELTPETSP